MQIKFAKKFKKHYEKSDVKIQNTFNKKLKIFLQNPFNPQLNNHSLTGKYLGFRSINITGDWRAIYSKQNDVIIFEILGTHSELYR